MAKNVVMTILLRIFKFIWKVLKTRYSMRFFMKSYDGWGGLAWIQIHWKTALIAFFTLFTIMSYLLVYLIKFPMCTLARVDKVIFRSATKSTRNFFPQFKTFIMAMYKVIFYLIFKILFFYNWMLLIDSCSVFFLFFYLVCVVLYFLILVFGLEVKSAILKH